MVLGISLPVEALLFVESDGEDGSVVLEQSIYRKSKNHETPVNKL
jgi:hypothetical protein